MIEAIVQIKHVPGSYFKGYKQKLSKNVFMVTNPVSPHTFYRKNTQYFGNFLAKAKHSQVTSVLCFMKNQIQKHSEKKRGVELYFTAAPLGRKASENLTTTIQHTYFVGVFFNSNLKNPTLGKCINLVLRFFAFFFFFPIF